MAQQTINTPRETTIQRIATALENILNKIVDTSRASNIDYDNTESDLTADKVQGAIDELAEEKVDKVTGKGLSTNDYTDAEKQKLANIESNAQANVQSDWNEDDTEDDAYIKNKPNLSTSLTATGNPLTIESSESNLVECVADVEAYQDLHGYDKPWVGGAGKNKYSGNSTITKDNTAQYISTGTISPIPAETYTFSAEITPESGVTATRVAFRNQSGGAITASNITVRSGQRSYVTVTLSEPCYMIYLYGYNDTSTSKAATYADIMIEEGSTATAYESYSNISPISGRSEVAIQRVGKNKLPPFTSTTVQGVTITVDSQGVVTLNGTSTNNGSVNIAINLKAGTYKISGAYGNSDFYKSGSMGNNNRMYIYDGSSNYFDNVSGGREFTLSQDATCTVYLVFVNGYTFNNSVIYPMIRLASDTDSTYEPYKGKTYTIQLGDTIYGSELDVDTGKLRVTHGEVDLGDLTWSYDSTNSRFSADIVEKVKPTGSRVEYIPCSCYQAITDGRSVSNVPDGSIYSAANSLKVYVHDSRFSDATAFKTAVTGQMLVYELAIPYTIQLTPQQIRLLKGTNNISCNTGDLSIKYYPDNVLGQLKGDIEAEYDERVEMLEEEAENALKIKFITTTTVTNQQGVSTQSYDNYVQGDKKFIPVSIIAKTTGYEVVDVHYVLDEINRLIYFIPKDLVGSAIPSGRTVSMTIRYFEI